jgi:predicted enzyme related to lactoylglutathione lyase
MSAAPSYPPGTPMWVDVSSPDIQAAARFYAQLFGWEADDLGEEAGHYTMFRKGGKMVAAGSPLQDDGSPPTWTTYICTSDATESARKVSEAGGRVIVEPFDVFNSGRMAIFQDPAGAFFAVWEPKEHVGAELVNAPGSFCWNELTTRDVEGAQTFYPRVFGWGVKANPGYTEWTIEGRSIAGALQMGDNFPPGVPPHWVVYFAVDDAQAAAAKAKELGGTASPIMDSPAGQFSIVNDPHGAVFAVIKLSQRSAV